MRVHSTKGGWAVRSGTTALVGLLFVVLAGSTAWASSDCTSDRRARPTHGGDPRSCRAIGYRGDTLVGSASSTDASDGDVAGAVGTSTGPVQPGAGQEVDLSTDGLPGLEVDAVVVGGNGWYNSYRSDTYLPPFGTSHHQHYIPPFDGNHRVPPVSYWFACYHHDPQPALPEVPQVLEVPLAGGAIFAVFLFVQHRRRKASLRHEIGRHSATS